MLRSLPGPCAAIARCHWPCGSEHALRANVEAHAREKHAVCAAVFVREVPGGNDARLQSLLARVLTAAKASRSDTRGCTAELLHCYFKVPCNSRRATRPTTATPNRARQEKAEENCKEYRAGQDCGRRAQDMATTGTHGRGAPVLHGRRGPGFVCGRRSATRWRTLPALEGQTIPAAQRTHALHGGGGAAPPLRGHHQASPSSASASGSSSGSPGTPSSHASSSSAASGTKAASSGAAAAAAGTAAPLEGLPRAQPRRQPRRPPPPAQRGRHGARVRPQRRARP